MVPRRESRPHRWATRFILLAVLCYLAVRLYQVGCGRSDQESRRTALVTRNIAALKDPNANLRMHAALALGTNRDPRAVEPLLAALKDPDANVRDAATRALGKIGAPAVEPLIAALKDPDTGVQGMATSALRETGAPAVEPLIAALKDANANVREHAADALGVIRDSRAVEPLIASLKDPEAGVRVRAAQGLGWITDSRAVEPLIVSLRDTDSNVQVCASSALGSIGAPAVERLIAALEDSDAGFRRRAAEALGSIEDRRAVGFLLTALKKPDLSVVAGACRFFIGRGEPGSEKVLIEALDEYGTKEMAQALLNCGNPELKAAAQKWTSAKGYYTIPELRRFGPVRWGNQGK